MDAIRTPPASAPSPSPSARGRPQGSGEGTAAPILTAVEESRFRAAARWSGDPFELAERLKLPYSELLRWLNEPHIAALLQQHDLITARTETNRQREIKLKVSTSLTTDFDQTQDPKERRRLSNPLLRASTPARPIATRARAGTASNSRCHHPRAKPARGAEPTITPDLESLPSHIAQAWTAADQAITAFSHTPPRIPKQTFLEAVTTYGETWESHHTTDTNKDARPLARPAPSNTAIPAGNDTRAPP
jgi:hypothetical protein